MVGGRVTAIAALVLGAPAVARASDFWITGGVSEVATAPDLDHYGVYLFAGVMRPIEAPHVWLIALMIEVCPEQQSGGGVAALTVERVLTTRVAADLIVSFVHDQPGLSFSDSVFSLGLGAGASITIGQTVVSPSFLVYRVVDAAAWSIAPAVAVSHAL